jgi:hypothetical protein
VGEAPDDIGWQISPFQYEVGVSDLAFGVTACAAFWASLPFKAAAVLVSSIALLGDAVGHVRRCSWPAISRLGTRACRSGPTLLCRPSRSCCCWPRGARGTGLTGD